MKKFTFSVRQIATLVAILFAMAIIHIQCDAPNNATNASSSANSDSTSTAPTSDAEATAITDNSDAGAAVAPLRIAFYNVENLFDIYDTPNKPDEEFLPNGRNKWTQSRYDKKLNQLSKVLKAMDLPNFVGVCEVENEQVIKDWIKNDQLKGRKYGIAHKESNDYRGIDVALLYDADRFEVTDIQTKVLDFPKTITNGEEYSSRDLFHVKGTLDGNTTLHFFVNHFPSRRGGLRASEPKRTFVASELRKMINDVLAEDENARIVIMGDFNDEPDNKSIEIVLGAKAENTAAEPELINCFAKQDANDEGSYNYRGDWNMLDQIILTDNFFEDGQAYQFDNSVIFRKEWMMYKDPRNGATPSRTYGGPNYYGGFSDHLPVYVDIR